MYKIAPRFIKAIYQFIEVRLLKLMGQKPVIVVNTSGEYRLHTIRFTESKKAYIMSANDYIGFLDNANQKDGEFRKGISSGTLVRWFTI